MKIHRLFCLSALLVLPNLALAKLPPNSSLGQVEGTLDFCAQADPQSASKYQEFKKAMVEGEPEKDVAEARKSSEYKNSYDAISEALGKVPKDKAVKACTSFLEGK
jgi:ABC-type taurine transport system substrate-binding protein